MAYTAKDQCPPRRFLYLTETKSWKWEGEEEEGGGEKVSLKTLTKINFEIYYIGYMNPHYNFWVCFNMFVDITPSIYVYFICLYVWFFGVGVVLVFCTFYFLNVFVLIISHIWGCPYM